MNYLKNFLNELTKDGRYYAEMIDNVAEIYIDSEPKPIVMLEFDGVVHHLNFRCDLLSGLAAQITYDMTMIDEDIVIGMDFFATSDSGLVYGEQALALYFATILQAFESAQDEHDDALDGALYIVEYPIETVYGKRNERKDKMRGLRGTDLE